MGSTLARSATPEEGRGRKRKLEESSEDIEDRLLNTPKKRKVKSTSAYIYERLFVNGENSDINIRALGKSWSLHKVYLCQAEYFRSMFSGSWRESTQESIEIQIVDVNVNTHALQIAFGSLYKDDVKLKPTETIPVLAVSMLLGMDGLRQQCVEIMIETISTSTVCSYHSAACMYANDDLKQSCLQWLERNIMTLQTPALLKEIRADLMQEIVSSPDLVVIQIEMDIYLMLKKWLYLQLHTKADNVLETGVVDDFYKLHQNKHKTEFLIMPYGYPYIHVFAQLRYQHIISDLVAVACMRKDGIIPRVWLQEAITQQWTQMLEVEQGIDKGPTRDTLRNFPQTCLRVGRVLHTDSHYCWRWTGYNYGMDILISMTNRIFSLKRNVISEGYTGSHSAAGKRPVLYKVSVMNLSSGQGVTKFHKTTDLKRGSLGKDEEAVLFLLERKTPFPLHLSANFLVYSAKPHRPLVIPEMKVLPLYPLEFTPSEALPAVCDNTSELSTSETLLAANGSTAQPPVPTSEMLSAPRDSTTQSRQRPVPTSATPTARNGRTSQPKKARKRPHDETVAMQISDDHCQPSCSTSQPVEPRKTLSQTAGCSQMADAPMQSSDINPFAQSDTISKQNEPPSEQFMSLNNTAQSHANIVMERVPIASDRSTLCKCSPIEIANRQVRSVNEPQSSLCGCSTSGSVHASNQPMNIENELHDVLEVDERGLTGNVEGSLIGQSHNADGCHTAVDDGNGVPSGDTSGEVVANYDDKPSTDRPATGRYY